MWGANEYYLEQRNVPEWKLFTGRSLWVQEVLMCRWWLHSNPEGYRSQWCQKLLRGFRESKGLHSAHPSPGPLMGWLTKELQATGLCSQEIKFSKEALCQRSWLLVLWLPEHHNFYLCGSRLTWANATDINIIIFSCSYQAAQYCWAFSHTEGPLNVHWNLKSQNDKRKLLLRSRFFQNLFFFFFFTKPKFWIGCNLTLSFWHSWDLRTYKKADYILLTDLSLRDPRGIYCT